MDRLDPRFAHKLWLFCFDVCHGVLHFNMVNAIVAIIEPEPLTNETSRRQPRPCSKFNSKFKRNKKVLLRERKRHTARRVVSTPSAVLTGYPPWQGTPPAGYPPAGYPPGRVPPQQGTPQQDTPPGRVPLAG